MKPPRVAAVGGDVDGLMRRSPGQMNSNKRRRKIGKRKRKREEHP